MKTPFQWRTRIAEYRPENQPFYLWLRQVTERSCAKYSVSIWCQAVEAGVEVSLYRGALPQATTVSLAANSSAKRRSETEALARAEHKLLVQELSADMDPVEREVLVLRHLEHLTNDETALVLDIKKSAASLS